MVRQPLDFRSAPEKRKFIDDAVRNFIQDFIPRRASPLPLVHLCRVSSEDHLFVVLHCALYADFHFPCFSTSSRRYTQGTPHLLLRPTRSLVGFPLPKRKPRIIGARMIGSCSWTPPSQDFSSSADAWRTPKAVNLPKIVDGFCHPYETSARPITQQPWACFM